MAYKPTRRALLLQLFGATGVLFRCRQPGAGTRRPIESAMDHLLLGVADLDRGVEWVEEKTGVRAIPGGSHPGVGTRNALLSLGGRRYLEIIAPDPAQTEYRSQHDVRRLVEPRLITWAAAAQDIQAVAARARREDCRLLGPTAGSRARPDGELLKWEMLSVVNELGRGEIEPIPFFIEWAADSLHPSEDSPAGCQLQTLEIVHPDAEAVEDLLGKLDIRTAVTAGNEARLVATLRTPRGEIQLS